MAQRRNLIYAFTSGRIAFGVALVAVPGRVGKSWIGPPADHPAVHIAFRALGARDIALAAGAALAATRGSATRPWLALTVASDLVDLAATLAAGNSVPERARKGTVALAGGAAVLGAGLTALVDE
jgi:hypothetical protein